MIEIENTEDAVIIALGSNLKGAFASSQTLLESALGQLPDFGMKIVGRSSWWRSAAWPAGNGPDFVNGVVLLRTPLTPEALLRRLLDIENLFGRQRDLANGPRTLDLDLIAYGRLVRQSAELVIPHPRAADRYFVMAPLAQVAPNWRHPVLHESAACLAVKARIGRDAQALLAA